MKRVYDMDKDCCGCTSCEAICPKNAITMQEDAKGYLYPTIDESKCINCGLCEKVCAFSNQTDWVMEYEEPICYAVKNKDQKVIDESRSGGVFTALSDYVLENKGVIYGAALEKDFVVRHIRAEDASARDRIRKSKYVQSELGDVFPNVKADLQAGRMVLFSGTGCQCHGLKRYLEIGNVSTQRLILCDVICNGVPSPMILREYIQWVETVNKAKLQDMEFRSKDKYGWETCVEKLYFTDRVKYQDYYANLYFDGLNTRESCFSCKYTTIHRATDFTLGDCWGINEAAPELYDGKGTSLLMIHTQKAKEIFDEICPMIIYNKVKVQDILQPRLKEPETKPENYEQFWTDVEALSFDELMGKYGRNTITIKNDMKKNFNRAKARIKQGIKKFLKL